MCIRDREEIEGQLSGCPLERLYLYEAADEYTPLAYEKILADCIKEIKPSIVLIGGTSEGLSLIHILAIIVIASVGEIITTAYKTARYGTDR